MKKILVILALAVVACFPVKFLLLDGYFSMHDDTQPARVIEMKRAMEQGQFPVRMVRNLGYGYGYPLYEFYAPLPYYIGAIAHVVGYDLLSATKIMMGIGMACAGFSMFALGYYVWGTLGGIIGATMYMFFPYHAVQLYVRGAVGELYAYIFLPLIILGCIMIRNDRSRKHGLFVLLASLSGIIISHTIYGYIAIGFCIAYIIFLIFQLLFKKSGSSAQLRYTIFAVVFALDLTAFFWLPAVFEMDITAVRKVIGSGAANFNDHYVCFSQFWHSQWGFGGSARGCEDGMSFELGKIHILIFFLSIFWFYLKYLLLKRYSFVFYIAVGLVGIGIFLMLPVSAWIWKVIPGAGFIQYPWRLLPIVAVGFSLISGIFFAGSTKKISSAVLLCMMVGVIFVNSEKFYGQYPKNVSVNLLESDEDIRWRVSKISDEYLPKDFISPTSQNDVARSLVSSAAPIEIQIQQDDAHRFRMVVTSDSTQKIRINRAYFPGFSYTANGKKIIPNIVNGLVEMVLFEGSTTLEGQLKDTSIRRFANVLSIGTVLSLIAVAYAKKTNA